MMMPANYSAIAEDEMTYVVGGGIVADVLPAIMTVDNWKLVNTNMITLISNYTAQRFTNGTVGVIFGGNYGFGDVTESVVDLFDGVSSGNKNNGSIILNGVLAIVGGLANIYTLGNVTAASVYNTSNGKYAWTNLKG